MNIRSILATLFVAFVALGMFPGTAQEAKAQYGTYAYCNGVYRFGNCNGPIYQPQAVIQTAPVTIPQAVPYGQQTIIQQPVPQGVGNGLTNCTVIGGVLGGVVGNQLDRHHVGGTVAGALLGGAIGNLVCTNSSGQRVIVQQPQGVVTQVQQGVVVSGVGPSVPAELQVGATPVNASRSQRVHVPSDCDIDGHPELQDLKGLTPAQCAAVAKLASRHVEVNAPSAPQPQGSGATSGFPDLGYAYCPVNMPDKTVRAVPVPATKVNGRDVFNGSYCVGNPAQVIVDLRAGKYTWQTLPILR